MKELEARDAARLKADAATAAAAAAEAALNAETAALRTYVSNLAMCELIAMDVGL